MILVNYSRLVKANSQKILAELLYQQTTIHSEAITLIVAFGILPQLGKPISRTLVRNHCPIEAVLVSNRRSSTKYLPFIF
jgi:hypothetical protein